MNAETAGATLWIARDSDGVDPETRLLGLTFLRRAELCGERAGFSRILVEGDEPGKLAPGRFVVLSSRVIPEKKWLRELREMPAEPGVMEIDPRCAAVVETEDPARVLEILRRRGARNSIEALLAEFPGASGSLSSGDRFEISGPEDLRRAERWMLRRLIKDSEGFMSRHVERRISLAISRRLAATSVTPNQMTIASVLIGLAGAALFLSTKSFAPLAGALLVLTHSILDGCDGELARLKFQESRFGGVLDFWGDNVVHSALFAAIAVAWARGAGESWPLLLGASAVAGTILCAGFVYATTMTGKKDGPLFTSVSEAPDSAFSRVVDALSRRDFLYLVVILSAFHQERWFLALAAVGAPVYFLVLVSLARQSRARRGAPAAAVPGR